MAGETPTEAHNGAWWRRELARFDGLARASLKRQFPSVGRLHDDLVHEALVALTAQLSQRPSAALPASWFKDEEPAAEDVRRFQSLAFAVLRNKVMDHFRSDYRKWALQLPIEALGTSEEQDHDSAEEPAVEGRDAGGALDLTRTARALMVLLAELPDRDRLLMEEVALGGRDHPLDESERQRIHRLRARLLGALKGRLGLDPIDLLRQL
ncbi:hypothetical protein QTH97_26320 [Variovorax sp. J22R24]|uniref:RNA polymerase sigma factor n=1 Tax=Variovorax gracilis TaxID=3053502 RepID=UPI002577AC84|nr:hypothetical protein [Variovorax sp. J22R24]MDM0108491.1 hypothetical protein [Variovorax sp. J22R24]